MRALDRIDCPVDLRALRFTVQTLGGARLEKSFVPSATAAQLRAHIYRSTWCLPPICQTLLIRDQIICPSIVLPLLPLSNPGSDPPRDCMCTVHLLKAIGAQRFHGTHEPHNNRACLDGVSRWDNIDGGLCWIS